MQLLAICLAYSSSAQDDASVPGVINSLTSSSVSVAAIEELPANVRAGIASILKTRLGDVAASLNFSTGQILYAENRRDTGRAIPLYDLRLLLSDSVLLGSTAYELELRVDEKGRLLYINWPASGYAGRDVLAPRAYVAAYATQFAKRSRFYSAHFHDQLQYYAARDKMVWLFQYPVKDLSKVMMLRTVEIDWLGPKVLKQFMGRY